VDDEANTLASLARAFRLADYEVTVCDSAERALERSYFYKKCEQLGINLRALRREEE
jgi:hypothetical protein